MDQTSFPVDPAEATRRVSSLPASRVQSWAGIAARIGAGSDLPTQLPAAAA